MPEVENELARFADFAEVFGKTAPSQAATEQTLSVAYQWSTLRIALTAWMKYAIAQEVAAWVNARSISNRLSPAFALAVKTDSEIGVSYPSLGLLFGVRALSAKRGAAAREANRKQNAAGLPEYKGAVGKKRKKADAKAALAAQEAAAKAAASAPAQPSNPAPAPTVAVPAVASSPTVAPAAVVAPPVAPAVPPAPTPAVNTTTTVGHS